MGKPVTVDSDDLEALIQAANVTVMVERAISAAKQDPIYQRTKDAFSEASARIQKARNAAIRQPSIHEARPMDDAEFDWIKARLKTTGLLDDRQLPADPDPTAPVVMALVHEPFGIVDDPTNPTCDDLRKKRLIETGNKQTFIAWGGPSQERIDLPQMVFRLTARGEAEYERIERARRAAKA